MYLVVDREREVLAERIEKRCDAMLERGLLREVRELRDRGYGPELSCMRAIGYRHMQPVLDGQETLAGVRTAMVRDTKQYARRQRTWFRRVEGAVWIGSEGRRAKPRTVGPMLRTWPVGPASAHPYGLPLASAPRPGVCPTRCLCAA